jgi:hypothetical protein
VGWGFRLVGLVVEEGGRRSKMHAPDEHLVRCEAANNGLDCRSSSFSHLPIVSLVFAASSGLQVLGLQVSAGDHLFEHEVVPSCTCYPGLWTVQQCCYAWVDGCNN